MSLTLQNFLLRNRGHRGIYSVCSAQRWVLEAAMQQARKDDARLLIEATSNQVNQEGGYTGMRPADFRDWAHTIAQEMQFPLDMLVLGGDHLGPNPWQHLPAEEAMQRASVLVAEYAAAGFTKLHLDASMACKGDPIALSDETVAERAAVLCAAAEKAVSDAGLPLPIYVAGTEVPVPGGASHTLHGVEVTTLEALNNTFQIHRKVFHEAGLREAFRRVVAFVVQPGVEFDHDSVIEYAPHKAEHLQAFLKEHHELVFEAHSTDYQQPHAYHELIRDGFSILKVGPALTFAMREALFALASIERELITKEELSNLPEVLEEEMLKHPENWKKYYEGDDKEQHLMRIYSYSDRIRYYWNRPEVEHSVKRLIENLSKQIIPETLLSQYLPAQYRAVRAGGLEAKPEELIRHSIQEAILPYSRACRG